jgi:hypothetical protein
MVTRVAGSPSRKSSARASASGYTVLEPSIVITALVEIGARRQAPRTLVATTRPQARALQHRRIRAD